jgi:hypothetical protein
MDLVVHGDVQAFARPALPLLWSDPVRHTTEISVLDALCRGQERAAALLTVHDAGEVVGAALRTPGRPVLVSALRPGHTAVVDDALAAAVPDLPGVSGPTTVAEAFAVAHVARTGARVLVEQRTRLFTLDELVPRQACPARPGVRTRVTSTCSPSGASPSPRPTGARGRARSRPRTSWPVRCGWARANCSGRSTASPSRTRRRAR